MPKLDISSQQRSALRAAAHPLRPVVLIGDRGLSDAVLKEIDLNLSAHQLIKVRVGGEDREAREAMLDSICDALSCAPVHHLGKTLILYRPDPARMPGKPQEPATRAVRKPSEPYVPKKQAAQGAPKPRSAKAAPAAPRPPKPAAKTARRPAPDRGPHGIPRRSGGGGSALTLRAGLRRSPRSGKR